MTLIKNTEGWTNLKIGERGLGDGLNVANSTQQ
jgi:hypothetical protein